VKKENKKDNLIKLSDYPNIEREDPSRIDLKQYSFFTNPKNTENKKLSKYFKKILGNC